MENMTIEVNLKATKTGKDVKVTEILITTRNFDTGKQHISTLDLADLFVNAIAQPLVLETIANITLVGALLGEEVKE